MPLATPSLSKVQLDMWNCQAKRQFYISGRRAGKTHVSLLEHIDLSIRQPGSRSWYVGPNYPLMKPFAEQLTQMMTQMDILASHSQQDHVWQSVNQGLIQFKSADEPEMLRGWDCDLVTIDEASLCKELSYTNCLIATNIRAGTFRICCNVPEPQQIGFDWTMRVFEEWKQDPTCHTAIFPEWANEVMYPGGELDPKIQELKRALPPAIYQRHVAGDMRALTGIIYPEFSREKHVIGDFSPRNAVVGVDPAFGNPAAILTGDYDGRVLTIYDEIYAPGLTDPDICSLLAGRRIRPELVVSDKENPGLVSQLNATRWGDPRLGVNLFAVSSPTTIDVHAGIFTVKTWFHQGRIRICRRCSRTIWELERYTFTRNEKPLKLNDHAMDALRYIVTTLDATEQENARMDERASDDVYIIDPGAIG